MNLRSGKVKHSGETRKRKEKMNNSENNQEMIGKKIEKDKLEGEDNENEGTAINNKREKELLEIRNREIEVTKDKGIELEIRERQHAKKTGTIPKATIRSIETIDKDRQNKDILQKHNIDTEIINSTYKGMLSPNAENTVGYWRILEEEENLDLDKIKCRELELQYWEREREIRRSATKKLDKERLEIEKITKGKLERDKLKLEIYKRTQREEKDRTFEIDSFTPFQIMLNWPVKF